MIRHMLLSRMRPVTDLAHNLINPEATPTAAFVQLTRDGLGVDVARDLMGRYGLTTLELFSILGTSSRTFRRREVLNSVESDRLLRFVSVMRLAEDVFDGPDPSRLWLHAVNRALGGLTPVSLLDTDAGSRQVETVLGRLKHGVYS